MSLPSSLPATLVAGDSWTWSDAQVFLSHPPAEWRVTAILRPINGAGVVSVTAQAGANSYLFTAPASQTASQAAGEWDCVILAEALQGDARAQVSTARVTVAPDPATATGDRRSHSERVLEAINASLEGRATKDADSYSIEGRSIARTPITDLLRLQEVYRRRVASERMPHASFLHYRRARFT